MKQEVDQIFRQQKLAPRNPVWYLVFIIYASKNIKTRSGVFRTQECLYLVAANCAKEAFTEALKWASPRQLVPIDNGETVELPLLGVKEVMPVWEKFENGSELGFRDGENLSWKQLTDCLLTIEDVHDEK